MAKSLFLLGMKLRYIMWFYIATHNFLFLFFFFPLILSYLNNVKGIEYV